MHPAIYQRDPREYERPPATFDLDVLCPSFSDAIPTFAAGPSFHQEALARFHVGQAVRIELVPEPGNPHDNRAVALDVDGLRCAYIHSDTAAWFHDIVTGLNRAGYAVFTAGAITAGSNPDGETPRGLQWTRPNLEDRIVLAELVGLREAHERVVATFTAEERREMAEDCWSEYSNPVVRALRKRSDLAPELTWSTQSGLSEASRVPVWHHVYVRQDVLDRRALASQRRYANRLLRRRIKAFIAADKAEQREATKALKAQQLTDMMALRAQGRTYAQIAALLDVPHKSIERLVRAEQHRIDDAAGTPSPDFHNRLRTERVERAALAVALQGQGLSRQEIAARLEVGLESVKQLLSDGKFYQHPAADTTRLERAGRTAELLAGGATRADVSAALELSPPATATAMRDAHALAQLEQ